MKPSSAVTLALVGIGNACGEGHTHHFLVFLIVLSAASSYAFCEEEGRVCLFEMDSVRLKRFFLGVGWGGK